MDSINPSASKDDSDVQVSGNDLNITNVVF